jgi:hypothetical protein
MAAQSALTLVTIELDATVMTVADGAPVPVFVLFVAGVAASCAPDQRSTIIECQPPEELNAPDDTVMLAPAPTAV